MNTAHLDKQYLLFCKAFEKKHEKYYINPIMVYK